jgi:DNA modification methylase
MPKKKGEAPSPAQPRRLVSESRNYRVLTVAQAREVAEEEVGRWDLEFELQYGLPEIDDRYHVWRVPLMSPNGDDKVGELVIDARTSLVQTKRSSEADTVRSRVQQSDAKGPVRQRRPRKSPITRSELRNTVILGDSEVTLTDLPASSVDLVFTSPPYYNARPDYTDYVTYEEYLLKIRKVIQQCHRLLSEGRFFAMNISPVLLRRASRSEASRRIAVPFDMHRLFVEEGFEFIDDIIWVKPEGAGWATGRGRRFAADRTPLQYKAVPVTEYVLVYRKQTDRLIDWNIRNHHDPEAVQSSKIEGDYERTNVWAIHPAHTKEHPAVFPVELAERIVRYYSFEGDVVLDPFGGIGTTGSAASRLGRRWVLAENDPGYVDVIRREAVRWLGKEAAEVLCVNCDPIDPDGILI